jgi:hypothetical protein
MLVGSELRFIVSDGSSTYKKSGGTLTTSTWYDAVVSFNTSDNTIKLWLDGSELTGTNGTASSGMAMAENCDIGRDFLGPSGSAIYFNGQVRRLEIVTSAVASVSAFNSATKSKIYPIGEKSGGTSYSTVATSDPDITWTNSPGWTTQNDYFWNQIYGATKSGSVYIPALLSKASDAAGNSIGLPAGNYLNNTAETVNLAPITGTQWVKYAATVADFDGSDDKVKLDASTLSEARAFKIELTANFDSVSSSGEVLYSSTSGVNDRIVISREDNDDLRFRVYDGSTNAARTPEFESISAGTEYKIVAEWNGSDTATLTVNGSSAGSSGVADVENTVGSFLGAHAGGGSYSGIDMFEGTIRDVKLTDDGTLKVDLPLGNNSLDYTANADHGLDTSLTYLSHAGTKTFGTVVTPQSADAATSDQEKELIMFTIGTE